MNFEFSSRRRESLVIIVHILRNASKGTRKTHLLYSVGLSYLQLQKYLGFLRSNGFVKSNGALYKTTDKGFGLIEEFESSPLTRSILTT